MLRTGVIQLLSKWSSFGFSGGKEAPLSINSERILFISLIFSFVSFEALNLLDLCWFIFALGAYRYINMHVKV